MAGKRPQLKVIILLLRHLAELRTVENKKEHHGKIIGAYDSFGVFCLRPTVRSFRYTKETRARSDQVQ